ncbi:ATP-binding protein [Aliiglaciecola sp. SL4]|uniref:GAF domain-containing hybrid sensor histidine kinase/response regulator n=1 Tax=Aliiglaciecola sp. SL4 TaxID=3239806 RepID=UPI00355C0EFB
MYNLTKLYQITSDNTLSDSEKMISLLRFGADYFQLELGIISEIDNDIYTVKYAISPDDSLMPGTTFDVAETYCLHTLETDQALSFYHAGKSRIAQHPCYQNFGLESYIGAPLIVEGRRFGTINFSASAPRSKPFSQNEHDFIELLSHWVGNEIARFEKIKLLQVQQVAMARQQNILEQMGQVADVGAWEFDLVENKLYWSEVTKRIHEVEQRYEPTLESGLDFYKSGENKQRITSLITNVIENGGHFSGEFEIVTFKGNAKWVTVKGKAELYHGECVRIVGAFQDITVQVKNRIQLESRHKELSLALEARSLFLANMSHEIRTPINGVLGMLQILESSPLNQEQMRFIGLAKDSATSLLGIISDILDFTKIDSDKLSLEKVTIDLNQLLNNCVDIFNPKVQDKPIKLVKNFQSTDNVFVISDPTRLRQICSNLLSNAIKFTSQGNVTISSQLSMQSNNQAQLSITVEDSGVGINKVQLQNLFSPFNQADASTTRKFGGTGLGLSITRKLCQLMGGDVSVESAPHIGSKFTASINVGIVENAEQAIDAAEVKPTKISLEHLRVLIVEDNEINQVVISEMLKQQKIKFDIVKDGIEALAILKHGIKFGHDYSLILMDCQMPNMDGYETSQHIRQLPAPVNSIPIIALTANAMSDEREKCLACGMNEYISKPIEQGKLYSMLDKFS